MLRLLKTTHRIKYYEFWRIFYATLDANTFLFMIASVLRFAQKYYGSESIDRIFKLIYRNFVSSGWPVWKEGGALWVNLEVARFLINLRRQYNRYEQVKCRPVTLDPTRPLRVGFYARFNSNQIVSKELFEAFPGNQANLFIFDKPYSGNRATYLEPLATEYTVINFNKRGSHSSHKLLRPAADAINKANLDILINISGNYDLMDMIDTPCLINLAMGSDLLHHEKVRFHIQAQIPADYLLRNNRIFNCLSRTYINSSNVYGDVAFYDRHQIAIGTQALWKKRLLLIVLHGNLRYLNSPQYLKLLFKLLQMDSDLDFVFMGQYPENNLPFILESAKKAGVFSRFHYEGTYSLLRNEKDEIADPGWQKMLSLLMTARLSPDPWPLGGGASRFECYCTGVPSVHLGVDNSRSSWGKPRSSVCEVLPLIAPKGTAQTVDEYFDLCVKCLYEKSFSDDLIKEQWETARRLGDPNYFWQKILGYYDEWLKSHTQ